MKVLSLRLALQTALAAVAFSVAAHADELQAKIEYCKDCHGTAGQGYRGYYAIPRLAGQQPEYVQNQLRAFIERRRTNPVMENVAHVLSPSMLRDLASHFRNLNPPPLGGAPGELISTGKKLYDIGAPEANVPACAACHGPDAKGEGTIPRLAGQLYPYLIKALTNFEKERGQGAGVRDTSSIMAPVAHSLSKSQVAAVAAYLSTLK
jgi:cytochrome c553